MTKRLMAKVGEYEKDGQTKGRYVELGVILSNQNGEYAVLDPAVNLAGVLMQQRILAQKTNGRSGDRVMCGIFDNDRSGQQQSGGQAQGGGYGSQPSGSQTSDFEDSIPF